MACDPSEARGSPDGRLCRWCVPPGQAAHRDQHPPRAGPAAPARSLGEEGVENRRDDLVAGHAGEPDPDL
ncbi:hypothetical protein PJI17_07990, partial [Mycobacterium kansasii]